MWCHEDRDCCGGLWCEVFFICPGHQDSSITDIVCRSLGRSVEPTNNRSLGSIKERSYLRSTDLRSKSDLDSIRNFCDILFVVCLFWPFMWCDIISMVVFSPFSRLLLAAQWCGVLSLFIFLCSYHGH